MRVKFTAGRISSFTCPPDKSSDFMWDTDVPGLGLKASPGGSKLYILQSRLDNGKSIRMSIGKLNAWPIDEARAEARRLQSLIDQGRDPRQEKAEQSAKDQAALEEAKINQLRNSVVAQTIWDEYVALHQDNWSAHHVLDHKKVASPGGVPKKRGSGLTVNGALYPILQMRMTDVTAEVLASWQLQESQTRANSARHAFLLFRAFWRWCSQHKTYTKLVDISILDDREVRRQVPSAKTKLFDVLQRSHLPSWFLAVRAINNPVISAYLQGLLLTGTRREELAALKWSEVDFKWNSLWVKDKVETEGRMIPLTPYFAGLLKNLPRRNQWVFSSPTAADGKIAEPRKAHNQALTSAELDHVTLHGLRRTFASLAEWVEMPIGVIAQIMGHAPNATAERHYKNRPLELLAIWHGKYESWILEQGNIKFDQSNGEVVLREHTLNNK